MTEMVVKLENIEIRGHEVKTSRKDGSEYLIVRYEDETGKNYEIVDRNMGNEPGYKRGTVGDFYANLRFGKTKKGDTYANLEVSRFEAAKS